MPFGVTAFGWRDYRKPHLLTSRVAAREVKQILLRVGLAMALPVQHLGRPVLCPTRGEACVFRALDRSDQKPRGSGRAGSN